MENENPVMLEALPCMKAQMIENQKNSSYCTEHLFTHKNTN